MATSNRRVATYLPPEIDGAFTAFKIQRGLATEDEPNQNDSQGLIQILTEFLGVSRESEHSVSYLINVVTQDQLDSLRSELVSRISELSSELQTIQKQIEVSKDKAEVRSNGESEEGDISPPAQNLPETMSGKELASFIHVSQPTISIWKKNKSPQQLADDIQEKTPDGSRWVHDPETNRFKKVSNTPGMSQGSLLNS